MTLGAGWELVGEHRLGYKHAAPLDPARRWMISRGRPVVMTTRVALQHDTPLPLRYRRDVVQQIVDCILAGDSCALVGMSSIGKSNLFRFFLRPDVHDNYFGDQAGSLACVYVDGNALSELSEFGVYELLLRRMRNDIALIARDPQLSHQAQSFHQAAIASESRLMAQQGFADLSRLLSGQFGLRIAFFFDEFDELLEHLDQRFFLNLRSIRDEFKYKICYVVATRRAPERVREDVAQRCEAFYELLALNVFGLKPYSRVDALDMITRLSRRYRLVLSTQDEESIATVTAGHPGLIAAVFEHARREGVPRGVANGLDRYLQDMLVLEECRKIWLSIDPDEQHALIDLAHGRTSNGESNYVLDYLEVKGLIGRNDGTGKMAIFSTIFERYVVQYGSPENVDPP